MHKKQFFRIALVFLSIFMLCTLVACTDTPVDDQPQTPDEPDTPTEELVDIVKDGATTYRLVRSDLYTAKSPTVQSAISLRKAIEAVSALTSSPTTRTPPILRFWSATPTARSTR